MIHAKALLVICSILFVQSIASRICSVLFYVRQLVIHVKMKVRYNRSSQYGPNLGGAGAGN
jgi:hypothetical protein